MKRLILLLCLLSGTFYVQAQDRVSQKKAEAIKDVKCPKAYFGVSTGINNPNGVLGFNVDIPIKQVSVGGGVGVSTWGNKIYAEGRYYLRPCQRGFAFGGGITHNAGRVHAQMKLETDQGKQNVTMNLNPQTNAFIAAYHFWSLGKRHNRFYVDAGYSVPLQTAHFKQVFQPGQPTAMISSSAKDRLREFSPGGLMLGFGFSFGLK